MPLPLAAIGLGMGLLGAGGGAIGRGKANREMEALMKQNPMYSANPMAQQRLGLAQTLLNARMPGSARAEQNIWSNQANTVGNFQRGATDGAQLLQMGAMAQGQTNNALDDLQTKETMDYERRFDNLGQAQEGVIREGDKVFGDQVRSFQDKVQMKGAQNANRAANWQSLSNMGFGMMSLGMSSGFGGASEKKNPRISNSPLTYFQK